MEVPDDAFYGAQTARAIVNFPVSGRPLPPVLIRALVRIKRAWALTNGDHADPAKRPVFDAIVHAALSIEAGKYLEQFPVDVFQTGSGTSSNMNANEVLASLASRLSGLSVHPNDDVNRCQSSNDVFPTAIQLALIDVSRERLLPALESLKKSFDTLARENADVVKVGRTHLQDATPVLLGQEFSGYAAQLARSGRVIREGLQHLYELPLGGTAVGTGLNAPAPLVAETIARLASWADVPLVEAADHFEAQSARDGIGLFSGALRTLALALFKIANDIRWLASGPDCGIAEITIPATQPGSSIMPAKVNPVQAESVMQVAARVLGNDACVAFAVSAGNFELNTMMPVMALAALESAELLASVIPAFESLCVRGITADRTRCAQLVEKSLALITAAAPLTGYERAAAIAKRARSEGRTLREILIRDEGFAPDLVDATLDPARMTLRPLDPAQSGAGGG